MIMMRIEGWRAKEIFSQIAEEALKEGNAIMDDVVVASKRNCPVGTITRDGKTGKVTISFTAKAGTKGARAVSFEAQSWSGRYPGQLRDTIRRVNKRDRPGNIRVYAGDKKTIYARFLEYGTAKMKAHPFMRPGFQQVKNTVVSRIEKGIAARVPEVKA